MNKSPKGEMQEKDQTRLIEYLSSKIKSKLSPDLLKPKYRLINSYNPMYGHCYIASEALFHLNGGKASGLSIKRARDDFGISHWWLESDDGEILDLTADQYKVFGFDPPYSKGVKTGFLTKEPSKRAKLLMSRVLT